MTGISIALGFSLLYLALLFQYYYFWNQKKAQPIPIGYAFSKRVTIIVVARNTGTDIAACVQSIIAQDYPAHLVEIIVIDDHSLYPVYEELKSIADPRLRVIRLADYPDYIHPPAFKKSGVTLGVAQASGDIIGVTDADCLHEPGWLSSMLYAFHTTDIIFQTGPVLFTRGTSLLSMMQEAEQLTLMLVTASGIASGLHDLANGANMFFSKKAFTQVNGFEGNFQYASGDDMFLIEKMRNQLGGEISFLKSRKGVVWTTPKHTWSSLLSQRIRWSGKNKGLANQRISRIWFCIGLYHVLLLAFPILAILHVIGWWPVAVLWGFKWLGDFAILHGSASFFRQRYVLLYFIPLQLLYSFYILALGVAFISGKKDDWSNRQVLHGERAPAP